MVQVYKIHVHTEFHQDTGVFTPFVSVNVNFYMGTRVKHDLIFIKLYTMISQYIELIHAKFYHYCYKTFEGNLYDGQTKLLANLNQNLLGSSLGLIIAYTTKKFQPLAYKTLLLILARFSRKMPLSVLFRFIARIYLFKKKLLLLYRQEIMECQEIIECLTAIHIFEQQIVKCGTNKCLLYFNILLAISVCIVII